MFTAKRNSGLLQNRSEQGAASGQWPAERVKRALPSYLAGRTRRLRAPDVLQMRAVATEKVWKPKASWGACFQSKIKFPGTFGHASQMYPMGNFVRSPYLVDETRCSYVMPNSNGLSITVFQELSAFSTRKPSLALGRELRNEGSNRQPQQQDGNFVLRAEGRKLKTED
jgi:hypothetical protein